MKQISHWLGGEGKGGRREREGGSHYKAGVEIVRRHSLLMHCVSTGGKPSCVPLS
jgi:hypothetical protein